MSEAECKTIYKFEIESTIESLGPKFDTEADRNRLNSYAKPGIEMCKAGHLYDRNDYNCLVSATNKTQVNKCLEAHAAKIRL